MLRSLTSEARQELEAGIRKRNGRVGWLAGSLLLAPSLCSSSSVSQPRQPTYGWFFPQWAGQCHINRQSRQCPTYLCSAELWPGKSPNSDSLRFLSSLTLINTLSKSSLGGKPYFIHLTGDKASFKEIKVGVKAVIGCQELGSRNLIRDHRGTVITGLPRASYS